MSKIKDDPILSEYLKLDIVEIEKVISDLLESNKELRTLLKSKQSKGKTEKKPSQKPSKESFRFNPSNAQEVVFIFYQSPGLEKGLGKFKL
jgi:hypothetical protein